MNKLQGSQTNASESDGVDTLVAQVKEARRSVDEALSKLGQLSRELQSKVRGNLNPSLRLFANEHQRFFGAASQALKRASAHDRIVQRASDRAREEAQRQALREAFEARQAARRAEALKSVLPASDPFDDLYPEITHEILHQ